MWVNPVTFMWNKTVNLYNLYPLIGVLVLVRLMMIIVEFIIITYKFVGC